MNTCSTCRYWRAETVRDAAKPPKHQRGRCGSLDARIPVGPDHGNLTTFGDFGCVGHTPAANSKNSL